MSNTEDAILFAREARLRGIDLSQIVLEAAVVPGMTGGADHKELVQAAISVGYCGACLLAKARSLIGILSKGHPDGAAPFMGVFMSALEEELAQDGIRVKITVVEVDKT